MTPRPALRLARGPTVAGLLILLAGCAVPDDERGWVPTGANDANLRAMIADPQDLRRGRGSQVADGAVDARAIDRWRRGEVRLPDGQSGASGTGGADVSE
ncbi:hypothetical protein [Marinimicrococcus flavescens]|uniref:Uncharacterized protein n=1 Tax=Marinimicrococcus flavescens TaxID=3031815 RepID=A0AAP3XQ06_9PROT|nr:hypothetical protein [Marinimicrococcus flavescens]